MSVWGTLWEASGDHHASTCAVWVPDGDHLLGLDLRRPCTCGQPGAPIAYQESHILPSADDPRGGYVSVAAIPGHITRDGRDDGPDDEYGVWPWLRISVGQEDAVLDEPLVRGLREALDGWLTERAGEP